MFVGHYGVSFAAKRGEKTIPLWTLFSAVHLLDVFWAAFLLRGIEKVGLYRRTTCTHPNTGTPNRPGGVVGLVGRRQRGIPLKGPAQPPGGCGCRACSRDRAGSTP